MANNKPLMLNIMDAPPYCMIAWNVNGYSDAIHSWMKTMLAEKKPDILLLSETKRREETLQEHFTELTDYNYIINSHSPPHYHGVAMLIRKGRTYQQFVVDMGIPARKDTTDNNPNTGRVITILFEGKYYIIGTYVPNSGMGREEYIDKFNYRLYTWDPALSILLNACKKHGPTIWLGDINVAPTDIDVSAPKRMYKGAGFTPEERSNFAQFMAGGWVDAWRTQYPQQRLYSWRGSKLKKNYGMRLDNIIVSPDIAPYINGSFMIDSCPFSDHIPIGIYIHLTLHPSTSYGSPP